jgi:hypothetical protein
LRRRWFLLLRLRLKSIGNLGPHILGEASLQIISVGSSWKNKSCDNLK